MNAILVRKEKSDKQVLGELIIYDANGLEVFTCKTLELPDKDNEKYVSCIPEGKYTVVPRKSKKYKEHFHVTNVPNRSYILIHFGNYYTDILGCILVGTAHTDINGDGYRDVTSSSATMKKLVKAAPDGFILDIVYEA